MNNFITTAKQGHTSGYAFKISSLFIVSVFMVQTSAFADQSGEKAFRRKIEKAVREAQMNKKLVDNDLIISSAVKIERKIGAGKRLRKRPAEGRFAALEAPIFNGVDGLSIRIGRRKIKKILDKQDEVISFKIRILKDNKLETITWQGTKVNLFAPGYKAVDQLNQEVKAYSVHYHVLAKEYPNTSHGTISFSQNGNHNYSLSGTFDIEGHVYDFGVRPSKAGDNQALASPNSETLDEEEIQVVETSLLPQSEAPTCASPPPQDESGEALAADSGGGTHNHDTVGMITAASPGALNFGKRDIAIHVVTDYKMYDDNGKSEAATVNKANSLMAVVAGLFARDGIGIRVQKVDTNSDPAKDVFLNLTTASAMLDALGLKYRPLMEGDFLHLLSTKSGNMGGLAYLGSPCSRSSAFSNISNFFSTDLNTYSWSSNVVWHEIGHNLGSRHTHWCGWTLPDGTTGAIDGCGTPEGSCVRPPLPVKGTVMSYCHTRSGVGIAPSLGFGPIPLKLIKDRIAAATCLGPRGIDTTPPSVAVTPPTRSPLSNGLNTFSATATDSGGMSRVDFYIGTQLIGSDNSAPYSISYNIPSSLVGSRTLTAKAYDLAGNEGVSFIPISIVADTTAPVIFIPSLAASPAGDLATGGTYSNTVTFRAIVNDNFSVASVVVRNALTNAILSPQPFTPMPHFQSEYAFGWDSKTVPNGDVSWIVTATDPAGNTSTAPLNFRVNNAGAPPPPPPPPPSDTTPPTVSFTAPNSNATVSGNVTFSATASDAGGIRSIAFTQGATALGAACSASPCSVTYNVTTLGLGTKSITVTATDNAGNRQTSTRSIVVIDNVAPTVSITSPAANTQVTGDSVTIQVNAADLGGSNLARVEYYRGATLVGTSTTAPYSFSMGLASVANGSYSITAKAYDGSGNVTTSAAVPIVVNRSIVVTPDTVAPSVTWHSHQNGQNVLAWSPQVIDVSVSDNVGVTSVKYYVNGTRICSNISGTAECIFSISRRQTNYILRVEATDAANNTKSQSVTVRAN